MELSLIVESILFVSEQPLKTEDLIESLIKIHETHPDSPYPHPNEIDTILNTLLQKYKDDSYSFEIRKIGNGYQFLSKSEFYPFIHQALITKQQKRLSKAALEALSIVAYKQPVTKVEVEHIRGVNSDYAIQKLLEKKLIVITGRADSPGKPLLYGTSTFFLQYLGINQLEDLPKLKEFETTPEELLTQIQQSETPKPTA